MALDLESSYARIYFSLKYLQKKTNPFSKGFPFCTSFSFSVKHLQRRAKWDWTRTENLSHFCLWIACQQEPRRPGNLFTQSTKKKKKKSPEARKPDTGTS
jgi:hypothetical protein